MVICSLRPSAFFVACPHSQFLGGARTTGCEPFHQDVTLDIDEGTAELLKKPTDGKMRLNRYCWFIHTTRKHTAEKPRIRIVILLEEPVAPELRKWSILAPDG